LGAALHVQTARELMTALRYVSQIDSSLGAMLANEEFLRKPNAAKEIALASLQLAFVPLTDEQKVRRGKKHFLSFYWGHQPAHTR
jgi:processive 1,2-diacylglycerol beta-glucosyltransferase